MVEFYLMVISMILVVQTCFYVRLTKTRNQLARNHLELKQKFYELAVEEKAEYLTVKEAYEAGRKDALNGCEKNE